MSDNTVTASLQSTAGSKLENQVAKRYKNSKKIRILHFKLSDIFHSPGPLLVFIPGCINMV